MNRFASAFTALALAALLPAALAIGAAPAAAQQATPAVTLEGLVKLEKTIEENGKQKVVLEEPKVVVPGDKLLFTTRYRNAGAQPVDNFVVTNPVPDAVRVADESALREQVSVDGGKAWGRLAELTVKGEDGTPRPATAADITHIRWTVPVIAPGASGMVEYHAIVR